MGASRIIAGIVSLLLFLAAALLAVGHVDDEQVDFRTRTIAVCDYSGKQVYCADVVQVFCGSESYFVKEAAVVECGRISFEVPAVTGFASFSHNWKDPRLDSSAN